MRESRFRAWHKSEGMCQVLSLGLDSRPTVLRDKKGVEFTPARYEFVMMQSTGLRDRDGKEIYEGDILVTESSKGQRGVVNWKDGAFILDFKTPTVENQKLSVDHTVFIVGNIYENDNDGLKQP